MPNSSSAAGRKVYWTRLTSHPDAELCRQRIRLIQLGGARVTAIPAAHYELDHDERGYRYLGFIIEWNGVTFYHSGDTLVYPGYLERMKALPRADVAMVAANGRDAYREQYNVMGNFQPAEAVWLAQELGWDMLIGGQTTCIRGTRCQRGRWRTKCVG